MLRSFVGNLSILLSYNTNITPPEFGYKNALPIFTSRAEIELFTCKVPPK